MSFTLLGLFRYLWLRIRKKPVFLAREILLAAFAAFLLALASQTILPSHTWEISHPAWETAYTRISLGLSVNLIPFRTIQSYLNRGNSSLSLINLGGNIILFIPIGFVPPLLWKRWKRGWKTVGIGFLSSMGIEIIQLFIGRSVDIDDILLNTLGVFLGVLIVLRSDQAVPPF